MKQAIICDIDGCLIDSAWIWDEVERKELTGEAMWNFFDTHANSPLSKAHYPLIKILQQAISKENELIFLTARSEVIREETRDRLAGIIYDRDFILLMRPLGNDDPSAVIKEVHLIELLKNYEINLAIDDEQANCDMFEKYGVPCVKWGIKRNQALQVASMENTIKPVSVGRNAIAQA